MSMGNRDKPKYGAHDEADLVSGWFRVMCLYDHAGVKHKIKKRLRKRERIETKLKIKNEEL